MRRWPTVITAFAFASFLIAEVPPIQSYTVADGLAANQINQIVSDSLGFVWFCTPEGLSRFDGHRMVNFGMKEGLPHRNVTALLETHSGEYLVGTLNGLCRFHRGNITTYLPGDNRAARAITVLMQDSAGRIWCGTFGGLFEIVNGYQFRPQRLSAPAQDRNVVSDLLEDGSHQVWVATQSGVDVIATDGGVQHIRIDDWTQNVRALTLDRDGRVWAGTQGALILMRKGSQPGEIGVDRIFRQIGGVKLDITSLTNASDGTLWVGASAGILRSLPGAKAFRLMTRVQGLTDRQINVLAPDRAGNMWAGTEAAGVMQIRTSGFTTFREQDGLKTDRVWSVFRSRDGTPVAITTDESRTFGVSVFDGLRFHASPLAGFSKEGSWGHHILLQGRDGAWWAATSTGLCRYAAADAALLADMRPQTCYARGVSVYQIFEDSKGRIWAAAGPERLLRWDPSTEAASWMPTGLNPGAGVQSFAEDQQGNIWMGLFSGGTLLRYDGRQFTRFAQSDGVPGGQIRELLVDSAGRLWMTSFNGLGVVENPGSPHFQVRVYKASDGLSSDDTGSLVEDAAGLIYASTPKGVDRIDPKNGRIKHFTTADGLAHGDVTMAMRDRSGDLWFATTQGLSRMSPAADRAPAIPTVRITELQIGRTRYPVSQVGETRIVSGDLQPSQNQLQVAFVGFSDESEADLRYMYRLEGADTAWQGPGRDHEVNYAELAPGHYRFLVKAINSEGRESASSADVDFEILPPVWRRWWFESFAVAAMVCAAFLSYRRRLSAATERVRLLYEERLDERTRIARELHDTLLQNLAGISLQLDGVAKQLAPQSETAVSSLRAVRKQVDGAFREARQKVQDLRSPMLQGRALPAVLRDAVEQIVAGHPVHLRMTVTGQPRPMREEVDEALLRIGQEAVANAVRHAHAREIRVSLAYDGGSLRLRVEDDGSGFDPDEAGLRAGHWGLRNMRERADRIGARWKVETERGRGTTVEAVVRVQAE